MNADSELSMLWQVPINNGEWNLSDLPSMDWKGTDSLSCAIAHNRNMEYTPATHRASLRNDMVKAEDRLKCTVVDRKSVV